MHIKGVAERPPALSLCFQNKNNYTRHIALLQGFDGHLELCVQLLVHTVVELESCLCGLHASIAAEHLANPVPRHSLPSNSGMASRQH